MDRYVTVELAVHKEEPMPVHEKVPDLLIRWGLGKQSQECFWVIAYDAMMNIRNVVEVARGAYSRVRVHYPSVYAAVLAVGCERFQVAHNHPTGDPTPTRKDIDLTRTLMSGANSCGLFFEDHWIVTPTGRSYSFANAGLLVPANYSDAMNAV
jgi:DNA repair protein RadC